MVIVIASLNMKCAPGSAISTGIGTAFPANAAATILFGVSESWLVVGVAMVLLRIPLVPPTTSLEFLPCMREGFDSL